MNIRSYKFLFLLTLTLTLTLSSDDFFAVKDKVISESSFKLGFPLLIAAAACWTTSAIPAASTLMMPGRSPTGPATWAGAACFGHSWPTALSCRPRTCRIIPITLKTRTCGPGAIASQPAAYSYVGPFNLKAGFARNDLRQRPQLEFSRPYRYTDSEWSVETDIGRRFNLFLTAYAAFKELAYDEEPYLGSYNLAESLNHRQNTFGLRLNRRVFTSTVIFLNYEMSDYVFASRSERDTRGQTLGLGVELPEIGVLQGSFQIGLSRFDPEKPAFPGEPEPQRPRRTSASPCSSACASTCFTHLGTNFSYSASESFLQQPIAGRRRRGLPDPLFEGRGFLRGRPPEIPFLSRSGAPTQRPHAPAALLSWPFLFSATPPWASPTISTA